MHFSAGDRFGDLTIEREIGSGAFGTVYAARDGLLRRRVALKVVRSLGAASAPDQRARILAEARLVGALQCPAVATLYRVHELPGHGGWALELEFVDGASLDERMGDRRPVEVPASLRIFSEVIEALAAAHAAGIVHGDIKPANIVLDRTGRVKVVDFGVARMFGDATQDERRAGDGAGTPTYMAPEVCMGEPARPASDLWSAGVVLHRMLAGSPPFSSHASADLVPSILNSLPRSLPLEVPARVAALVARCLEKDPRARPTADAAFREELAELRAGLVRDARQREVLAGGKLSLPGRDVALRQVAAAIDAVREGTGKTLLIEAPSGYGVSTLLEATAKVAVAAGMRPLRLVVTPDVGLPRLLAEEARRLLEREPDGGLAIDPAVQHVLQREDRSNPRALLRAFEGLLRTLLQRTPVALLIDDAQCADHPDRRLLYELARRFARAPFLLAVGWRVRETDDATYFPQSGAIERIQLGPLPPEALHLLLAELGEGVPPDHELVSRIYRTTEGHPRFATEMFQHLRATGAIEDRDGHWRPVPGSEGTLPRRLESVATDRLSALAPGLREVLDVAATDGREFDAEAIVAVLGRPLLDVLRALQRLHREYDFVVPTERAYRFRHGLARDAIVRAVDPARRRELHRRLALHLESRSDAVAAERIGTHWEGAGEPDKAAPHLRRAMIDAALAHDDYRALGLAERSGLIDGPFDPSLIDHDGALWRTLTDLLASAGRFDDLRRIAAASLEHARRGNDAQLVFAILVQRARQLQAADPEADLHLGEIRAMIPDQPVNESLAWGHVVLGRAAKIAGDGARAIEHLTRALEVSRAFGGAEPFVQAATQLAGSLERMGRLSEAEDLYRLGVAKCAQHGHAGKQAVQRVNMALCGFRRGAVEGASPTIRAAMVAIALELAPGTYAHAGLILSGVLYAEGRTREAHRQATTSLAQARELSFLPALTQGGAHAAAISIAIGDLDEAGRIVDSAIHAAKRARDRTIEPQLRAIEAQHHWLAGRTADAYGAMDVFLELLPGAEQPDPLLVVVPWLAESVLYGMDPAALVALEQRIDEIAPRALIGRADLLAFAQGARAFHDPAGSIADLREAAARLQHPSFGERHALLRSLGLWMSAEAALRAGELDAARAAATDASMRARRLGHVWLEAELDRLLRTIDAAT